LAVTFAPGSQLLCIPSYAFDSCSSLLSVCIPCSVETLSQKCFAKCRSLSAVTFESGSALSYIENNAFVDCSSLLAICIPSSVKQLFRHCFAGCRSLHTLKFESGSQLSFVQDSVFSGCSSLSSIWIPPALQILLSEYQAMLKLLVPDSPSGTERLSAAGPAQGDTESTQNKE
jgi:hypothetical protein